jgi:O-methyltransferase involved in polyketide biosynthesis
LSWFEVDHPDTQEDKRARLHRLGLACAHVTFVPVDLGQEDVGAALAQAGHDNAVATLFVCEGIAPYLPSDTLTGLLVRLSERAAAGSTLVLELPLVPRSDEAHSRLERLDAAVSERGEPLRSVVPVDELDGLLSAVGGAYVARATLPESRWRRVRAAPPLSWPHLRLPDQPARASRARRQTERLISQRLTYAARCSLSAVPGVQRQSNSTSNGRPAGVPEAS